MKAFVLAAGVGSRMMPLTKEVPKPMLKLLGKPLLQYILEYLPQEVSEIILVVGYKREIIQSYFGESFKGKKITYLIQENPTGTADALKICRPYLTDGERFLLTFGDDIYDKESVARCLLHPYAFLIGEVADPRRYGVVVLEKDETILEIEEKPQQPKSNLVAPGLYIIDTTIFDYESYVDLSHECYLTPLLNQFVKRKSVFVEKVDFWLTFAYPEDLQKAEKILKSHEKG
ncbi:MAG: nucleotidyltransferase family protein [Candidatus Moranbacteria bacterium]|nr:nucleotidyltransferase family protein [Candidatus Moranbacteria bacterium]